MSGLHHRAELARIVAQERELREQRYATVARWRLQGATWTEIGEVLGVSKQAARQTYDAAAWELLRQTVRSTTNVVD